MSVVDFICFCHALSVLRKLSPVKAVSVSAFPCHDILTNPITHGCMRDLYMQDIHIAFFFLNPAIKAGMQTTFCAQEPSSLQEQQDMHLKSVLSSRILLIKEPTESMQTSRPLYNLTTFPSCRSRLISKLHTAMKRSCCTHLRAYPCMCAMLTCSTQWEAPTLEQLASTMQLP